MIYTKKIDAKISAIKQIDIEKLVKNQTYLPVLGTKYTTEDVKAWLDKLVATLEKLKLSDTKDDEVYTTAYTAVSDKTKADDLLDDKNVDFDDKSEDYPELVNLSLYKFATTP